MRRRLEYKDRELKLEYLYELVYKVCEGFRIEVNIEKCEKELLKAIDLLYYTMDQETFEDISKRIKIISYGMYNFYAYKTRNIKDIDLITLEGIYFDEELGEKIEWVGFLDAPDKCMEEELIDVFETIIQAKEEIEELLYWNIYNVIAFEYNVLINAETSGNEWVKDWNNYGGIK